MRPIVAEVGAATDDMPLDLLGAPARKTIGQFGGGAAARFSQGHDGTPDRAIVTWTVRAAGGTELTVIVRHDRAGTGLGGHPCSSECLRVADLRGSMRRWMT